LPETVNYLDTEKCIHVHSYGETSINDWENSMQQVIEIHNNTGCQRVLVDVREQNSTPSTLEILEFGKHLPYGIQFAIVATAKTHEPHYFLETVGRNRGKDITLFNDYDDALSWLTDG